MSLACLSGPSLSLVRYKDFSIHNQSFKSCKSLKTIVVKNTKNIWFSPDTFKGSNTKKMTVKFSKKMSKKTYAKMQKRLRKIGFKGKITRG